MKAAHPELKSCALPGLGLACVTEGIGEQVRRLACRCRYITWVNSLSILLLGSLHLRFDSLGDRCCTRA